MKQRSVLVCTLIAFGALGLASTAKAQVLPFNEAGVTMGHHHLMVGDLDRQRALWIDALGGEASGNPPLLFVKFPGAFLILSNGPGAEGTQGSALDHIAFNVRDLAATRARLAALDDVEIYNESATRFDAIVPGGIDVHFFGEPALATPIAHRAMAFAATEPEAQRAWWERVLGAQTSQEGELTVSTIPGARLFFTQAASAPAPTRGRSLDHTGIGVRDVGAFCDELAEKGVMCELMFGGAAAMITDPAGVAIEINAGLESR